MCNLFVHYPEVLSGVALFPKVVKIDNYLFNSFAISILELQKFNRYSFRKKSLLFLSWKLLYSFFIS